jgi:putative FmdB family regulatory protein
MPIYEYECTKCGAVQEVLQRFSDKPLTKCPNCSGKLQKLVSQSTFHLKGSGWYATDYASKSAKQDKISKGKQDDKSASAKSSDSGSSSGSKKDH